MSRLSFLEFDDEGLVRSRLGVDARALAIFMVCIGFLVLADVYVRGRDLVAFYTDRGVLPRETLFGYSSHPLVG